MNNFQTPKIQAVLSSFFQDSNDITRGSNREGGGGLAQYRSIKWSMRTIENQRSNLGSYWTFLVLTAFQTIVE